MRSVGDDFFRNFAKLMSKPNGKVYQWSLFDRVMNTAISMGGYIVLARLLTPADFGLLAMVGVFVGVAYNISSCGVSDWLVRQPEPTELEYSTAFVFNSALGLLFGCAFFFSGPWMANWFNAPPLVEIMQAIGICVTLVSMSFVQETRLRKQLCMKTIAIVRIASTLSSVGLGIYLALAGYGYWGLVSVRIFSLAFTFIYYVIGSRWFPRIQFSLKAFKQMFSYGVNLMLSYVCAQIGMNINASILGKISATDSGLYSQAQKMQESPFAILESSFNWPFFAVLSNEADTARRKQLVVEMGVNILLLNLSLALFLLMMARPGFLLLFGGKWDGSVPIFQLLIIYGAAMNFKYFLFTILKHHGITSTVRNITFIEVGLQLLLLWWAFSHGPILIALSQVATEILILIPITTIAAKIVPGCLHQMGVEVAKGLLAPVSAMALGWVAIAFVGPFIPLVVTVALATVVFIATFWIVCHRIDIPPYKRLIAYIETTILKKR